MALAVPYTANRPEEWIPADEAARLLGVSTRHARRLAAHHAARGLARLSPPPSGTGKAVWWVHRTIDPRLDRFPSVDERDRRTRESLLTEYPLHKVDEACRKSIWMHRWRDACQNRRRTDETEAVLAERVVDDARRAEGDDFAISERSLRLWWSAYKAVWPDGQIRGLRGLIDRRGEVPAGSASTRNRSQEAIDYFHECYRTQHKLSIRQCHDLTLVEAERTGWDWPRSYEATCKWLQRHDDIATTTLARLGPRRYSASGLMPHLEMDYSAIQPGEMYVADHHECDFWVTAGRKQFRPWLTAVQDLRSRCIVGWWLGPSPNQDAIMAAFLKAFREYAIPQHLKIDNGKDFVSRLLTGTTKKERLQPQGEGEEGWMAALHKADVRWRGLFGELGIKVHFALPYCPWAKGTLERFFGTFEGQLGNTFATYCGNSALNRPEYVELIKRGYTYEQKAELHRKEGKGWAKRVVLRLIDDGAIPTLDHAREAIGQWLDIYHREEHNFKSPGRIVPLEEWSKATSLRKADETALLMLCQSRGYYQVTGNGVRVTICSSMQGYGKGNAALQRLHGRKVLIVLDPNDVSHCHAFHGDTRRFIGTLTSNQRIPPHTSAQDLREAIGEQQRERKTMRQANGLAIKRLRTIRHRCAELRVEKSEQLKRTGTYSNQATITPVVTGFEATALPPSAVSNGVRTAVETPSEAYDRELRLAFHRHLFGPRECEESPTLDETESTDAAIDRDRVNEPPLPTSKRKRPPRTIRPERELWAEVHKEPARDEQDVPKAEQASETSPSVWALIRKANELRGESERNGGRRNEDEPRD